MAVLLFVILNLFVAVSCQDIIKVGSLEIVSDLMPMDCLNNDLNYIISKTTGLPVCDSATPRDACNRNFFTTYKDAVIVKPTNCAKDGSFEPVQCKGGRTTGRCFCFTSKGKRLFGQQWWSQADNMTCACSRRKSDMSDPKATDYVFYNSMHCDTLGNYEPLQCDVLSEQCWCADDKTGDLKSPVVPMVAMAKLPCYNSQNMGTQYLRECESKKYAQMNIQNQLSLHGTTATFGDFLCDDDGSYGSYTIIDGSAYCTWKDNVKVGSWSGNPADGPIDCNCARDTKYFELEGKEQLQKCTSNGNYQPKQGAGDAAYCVDKDGYTKSNDGAININQDSDCDRFFAYDD